MNAHIVVGVGNIYASESLHLAGIHPARAAGRVSAVRYDRLAETIRKVLAEAITKGVPPCETSWAATDPLVILPRTYECTVGLASPVLVVRPPFDNGPSGSDPHSIVRFARRR